MLSGEAESPTATLCSMSHVDSWVLTAYQALPSAQSLPARSTDERERSRVQRLLLEGMKLVDEEPRLPSSASPLEAVQLRAANQRAPFAARNGVQSEAVERLQDEVFGHLAVALRTEMICATDERLETLISPRFLQMTGKAFILCKSPRGTVSGVKFVLCVLYA